MSDRPPRAFAEWDAAAAAWKAAVGAEHVSDDPRELRLASTATFATEGRHLLIIRPATREEVQECLRIANRFRVPVYPVSGGRNYGLGSRAPVHPDGGALLSLDRMRRILHFDEELAVLRVEPGVTFDQAYAYLRSRGSRLMLNVTGSTSAGSLVGNALDRGHGYGPLADRFDHCHGPEVVLADGSCVHGGFDRFDGARAALYHKWGVGPHLDGLFSQSNLGVVTALTFCLSPIPADFQIVQASVDSDDRLDGFLAALRLLKEDGGCDIQLINRGRAEEGREFLGQKGGPGAPAWQATCALYAPSREVGKARRRWIEGPLRAASDSFSVVDAPARRLRAVARRVGLLRGTPARGYDPASSWFAGVPAGTSPLRLTYMAKARRPAEGDDLDPDRDGCGILWCAPVIPFTGADVARVSAATSRVCAAHGHRASISLRPMSARTLDAVIGIVFDREAPGADEKALAWHDELFAALCDAGYLPYRLNVRSMGQLPAPLDDYPAFYARLKQALDPNDVIAPGRYDGRLPAGPGATRDEGG